jgi:Tfp pilus assembly PilM family ATPase
MNLSLKESPLYKGFPVPSFLKMCGPGIEIGPKSITLFESRKEKGALLPKIFDHVILKKKCIVGAVEDITECNDLIRSLTELAQKHSVTSANITIPEEEVYVFSTMVYLEEGQAIEAALISQIEKNVPFSPDDITYDYQVVRQQGRGLILAVVASSKKTIQRYEEIFLAAGITPLRAISENQAIINTLLNPSDVEPHLVVHVSEDRAVFSICENGIVELTSSIVFTREFEGEIDKSNVFVNLIQKKMSQILMHWYGSKKKEHKAKMHHMLMYTFDTQVTHDLMVYLKNFFPHLKFHSGTPWENMFDIEDHLPDITKDQAFLFIKSIGASLMGQKI